jgi:hypothetical protein
VPYVWLNLSLQVARTISVPKLFGFQRTRHLAGQNEVSLPLPDVLRFCALMRATLEGPTPSAAWNRRKKSSANGFFIPEVLRG